MKKINLEEILFKELDKARKDHPKEKWIDDDVLKKSIQYPIFINIMKEAVQQALELAAEKIKSDAMEDFGSEVPDCWNDQSILDTINLIE